MAADETTICNLALAHLGQGQIMSLDDESQAARYCKRFYAQTRDEVIQSHQWNFALKRARLTRLAEAPPFGWALQYQLPADFLRLVQLNDFECGQPEGRWEIEGQALLTDETTAVVRYLRRVEDGNFFTPLFVDALAMKLAARLAKPLTGSEAEEGNFLKRYEMAAGPLARRMDAAEGRPRREPAWASSGFVKAREADALPVCPVQPESVSVPVVAPPPPPPPPPPLPQYYVYLVGGIVYLADFGAHHYIVPSTPELQAVVTAPPFTVSYADKVTFSGAIYCSIEIVVYLGPVDDGVKVAYGNAFADGHGVTDVGQAHTTITLNALGCFDSLPGGPWNFNCAGI